MLFLVSAACRVAAACSRVALTAGSFCDDEDIFFGF